MKRNTDLLYSEWIIELQQKRVPQYDTLFLFYSVKLFDDNFCFKHFA
jgi:hypothetical protein